MKFYFNVIGERRKALVQLISKITGKPAVYASGFGRSYAIGDLLVDKDGILDYSQHDGFTHPLITALAEHGFPCELHKGDLPQGEEQSFLCIEMPLDGFTGATLDNLERLIAAKATLIKKLSVRKLCRSSGRIPCSASLGSAQTLHRRKFRHTPHL